MIVLIRDTIYEDEKIYLIANGVFQLNFYFCYSDDTEIFVKGKNNQNFCFGVDEVIISQLDFLSEFMGL